VTGVERDGDSPVRDRAQIRDDPADAVVGQHGHPVSARHPEAPEPAPEARNSLRSFAVAPAPAAIRLAEKDRIGRALRPVEEEFRQGLSHRVSSGNASILGTAPAGSNPSGRTRGTMAPEAPIAKRPSR